MSVELHSLPARHGRRTKRLGRGHGSGRGTYSGRGIKGQRSRTGGKSGLQKRALKALVSHLPKSRGFTRQRQEYRTMTLNYLEKHFKDGERVSAERLNALGMTLNGYRGWKVLGVGTLTKKLTVAAHAFSESAERGITKAGGSIVKLGS